MAGVLFCSLWLAACATPPQTRSLANAPAADLPPASELGQVPFFAQTRHQCGPAALATVLVAHGIEVTPGALVEQVYLPGRKGSLAEEITATARRYGMLAYPLAQTLSDLLTEVAHGTPVLVFQNLGLAWLPRWHFAVVVGYDLAEDTLVLRSGTTRRRLMTLAAFERTWARGDHRAWVILPPGRVPRTAALHRYLQAAFELEQSGQAAAARQAWRAATRHWPAAARPWLALGNNLYQAGEYLPARAAISQATRLAPQESSGWNNLAYALLMTGCPQQARRAAHCARSLAPADERVIDTLREIEGKADGTDAPECPAISCPGP